MDTKYEIAEAACRLFRRSTVDNVTVQQILTEARVSRTTFYHYFSDKYEIVTWYCDTRTKEIVERMNGARWKDIYIERNCFVVNNLNLFMAMLPTDAMSSLERFITKNSTEIILNAYLNGTGNDAPDWKTSMAIDFTVKGLNQVLRNWILNGAQQDVYRFSEVSFGCIPDFLRQYL